MIEFLSLIALIWIGIELHAVNRHAEAVEFKMAALHSITKYILKIHVDLQSIRRTKE